MPFAIWGSIPNIILMLIALNTSPPLNWAVIFVQLIVLSFQCVSAYALITNKNWGF